MRCFKLVNLTFFLIKLSILCSFSFRLRGVSIDFNFKFIVFVELLLLNASPIAEEVLRFVVKRNRSNVSIIHHFKNDVLISVAKSTSENV